MEAESAGLSMRNHIATIVSFIIELFQKQDFLLHAEQSAHIMYRD